MNIIRFGRHSERYGHIIIRKRFGMPARLRNMRMKVRKNNDRWICENGQDVHDEITIILLSKLCKS